MERELRQLVMKARESARAASATGRTRAHRWRGRVALLLVVVVVVALAAAGWSVVASGSGPRPTAYSAISQAGQKVVQAIDHGVARFLNGDGAAQAPAPEPSEGPTVSARRVSHAPTSKTTEPDVLELVRTDATLPSALALPPSAVLVLPAEQLEPMAKPDQEPGPLYTAQDVDVVPPVALPPLVGHVVAGGATRPGDMDVIVGRSGNVERVILLAPGRFQDKMLLAAIKNQQFRPALEHGRPVRYIVRLRAVS